MGTNAWILIKSDFYSPNKLFSHSFRPELWAWMPRACVSGPGEPVSRHRPARPPAPERAARTGPVPGPGPLCLHTESVCLQGVTVVTAEDRATGSGRGRLAGGRTVHQVAVTDFISVTGRHWAARAPLHVAVLHSGQSFRHSRKASDRPGLTLSAAPRRTHHIHERNAPPTGQHEGPRPARPPPVGS